MKPGVVLEAESGDILCFQRGGLDYHLRHRVQHEAAQLLNATFGPAEQIEATLEGLRLRHMAGCGISMLLCFALQKQGREFAVEALAIGQPRFAEGCCEQRPHDHAAYHRENPCWPGAVKRQRAVINTNSPAARSNATS